MVEESAGEIPFGFEYFSDSVIVLMSVSVSILPFFLLFSFSFFDKKAPNFALSFSLEGWDFFADEGVLSIVILEIE